MKNFHDIEQLSAYLDGQLSPSESAQVESRLAADPELASVFNDIRSARSVLKKLPARKAPRNFTLTRQMVGLKPPLPRTYSAFRFSTAFAAILLMLTFAANAVSPRINLNASTTVAQFDPSTCTGCGGGSSSDAAEAFAATEAPAAAAAPDSELAVTPTAGIPATTTDAAAREVETPTAQAAMPKEAGNDSAQPDQPQTANDAIFPVSLQITLFVIGLVSALIAFVMSRNAKKKWS